MGGSAGKTLQVAKHGPSGSDIAASVADRGSGGGDVMALVTDHGDGGSEAVQVAAHDSEAPSLMAGVDVQAVLDMDMVV